MKHQVTESFVQPLSALSTVIMPTHDEALAGQCPWLRPGVEDGLAGDIPEC
jgi:hypothetical protein